MEKVSLKELLEIVTHAGIRLEYLEDSWYIGLYIDEKKYQEDDLYSILETFFDEYCNEYVNLDKLKITYDVSLNWWTLKLRNYEDSGEFEGLIEELIEYLIEEEK